MVWIREDRRASAFRNTLASGPKRQSVTRRVTTDLHTGELIEVLEIDGTKQQDLHAMIPGGPKDITQLRYIIMIACPHGKSFTDIRA